MGGKFMTKNKNLDKEAADTVIASISKTIGQLDESIKKYSNTKTKK